MGPALQNAALPGGGQGRPPLQNPIGKRCVGVGVSDGPNWAYTAFLAMCHCEGAPRPWQSVPPSPTECLPMAMCRGRCPHRPAGFCAGLSVNHRVIAKPVRTLAVAIRPQSLPCLKGGGPAAGWWRDSCGEESPSHGFAVLRQGGHQPLRRFASVLIPHFPTRLLEKYFLSVIVHPKPNRL